MHQSSTDGFCRKSSHKGHCRETLWYLRQCRFSWFTISLQWSISHLQYNGVYNIYPCSGAQQFLKKKHPQETILQGDSRCWFSQFAIPSQSMKESIANYKCFELFRKRWQRLRISQRHCHGHGSGGCGVTDRCLTCQI